MENKNANQDAKGDFANKGHRLIQPDRKPAERPKPQAPKPDKK